MHTERQRDKEDGTFEGLYLLKVVHPPRWYTLQDGTPSKVVHTKVVHTKVVHTKVVHPLRWYFQDLIAINFIYFFLTNNTWALFYGLSCTPIPNYLTIECLPSSTRTLLTTDLYLCQILKSFYFGILASRCITSIHKYAKLQTFYDSARILVGCHGVLR